MTSDGFSVEGVAVECSENDAVSRELVEYWIGEYEY
jgi:hypothetical protein